MKVIFNTRFTQTLIAMLILGFASGLPIGISGTLLQAWFTEFGISLKLIGAVTLIGLPYTLKFLWAPIFDLIHLKFLDQYRSWIILFQVLMAGMVFFISTLSPYQHSLWILFIVFLVVFCSASQDVVIDAYRIRLLKSEERGLGSACSIFAWRMAALVSGGGFLIVAGYWGWSTVFVTFSSILLILACLTVCCIPAVPDIQHSSTSSSFYQSLQNALLDLFNRPQLFSLFAFIVLYKLGDALALSLMTNFLIKAQGFQMVELGIAYKTSSLIGGVLGGLLGGLIMTRISLLTALWVFGLAQAISNALFIVLALSAKHFALMSACVFIESFCSGMSTAAFLAFLISICHPEYPATQFALLSAIASLGRVVSGPFAAQLVLLIGWPVFFTICFLLSFPALFILMWLSPKAVQYEEKMALG